MRSILLCVLGLSPAVVTETLWALSQRRDSAVVPGEVHILTTTVGRAKVEAGLAGPQGAIARLCDDYRLPQPKLLVHEVAGAGDVALDDIRTQRDNTALADATVRLVAQLTEDPEAATWGGVEVDETNGLLLSRKPELRHVTPRSLE